MRVKQRLGISSITSVAALLVVVAVIVFTAYRVNRALDAANMADAIMTASYERLMLRIDNHRTLSQRSREQLIAKHREIGGLLNIALQKFWKQEDRETIRELIVVHNAIGKFSKAIRANREKRGPAVNPDTIAREYEDRLTSQMDMKVYEVIQLNSKLQESGNEAVYSSLKLAGGGILLALFIAGSVILLNSLTINRIVASRISILRDGAALIGGGGLAHRIDVKGGDEFRDLADSFNDMASKLSESYLELEKEIEERKRAEEALKASLYEKEILLKEIHHRVKNNLQVISSLVSLQAAGIKDEPIREVLSDVTYRVRSMALVHEKLYQSHDFARIDFGEYARSLLHFLWRSHGAAASPIRLTFDLQMVELPVDTAVPCGLILNELAGNALKHAFKGRSAGEVTVSLHADQGGRIHLGVADDGVGLPEGLDWRNAPSLGLRLVQMLSGQIGATLEVSNFEGTTFELVFNLPS